MDKGNESVLPSTVKKKHSKCNFAYCFAWMQNMAVNSRLLCLWTFPIVRYSKEHSVSETGSVSVRMWSYERHPICLSVRKS